MFATIAVNSFFFFFVLFWLFIENFKYGKGYKKKKFFFLLYLFLISVKYNWKKFYAWKFAENWHYHWLRSKIGKIVKIDNSIEFFYWIVNYRMHKKKVGIDVLNDLCTFDGHFRYTDNLSAMIQIKIPLKFVDLFHRWPFLT